MTVEKVTVPRKVADAIEKLLAGIGGNKFSKYGIIAKLDDVGEVAAFPELRIIREYYDEIEWDSPRHPHALMQALVNGYKVEKTPEEKVRELYRSGETTAHEAKAIKSTLNILGIKIEGVNAE